ncbi:hypothetical protein I6A84_26210 [Frankia sp. CNm7]|uniref:Uncharacterized protein n=1 Tax=Frankia nepalensis TaxID=1836974 RepID=A0A937RPZ4_9ACTN|nr:hypothetical protein [Frankia nepalensis]MBL7501016.1 hypothetical protein [Frankia nepalensis]MBL7512491.1 hypothetical protein [Frankia nepalensis]MBL7521481.1 hypothetical protein [Frankia nepalensis]MBL7632794.1 hypothetical protein [Frankia nepalensis]
MTPSWWTGLTPLEEIVPCGDAHHRIRWSDGELATPDHDDPDGERTLAALGGQTSRCIEILDAWQRHRADLDALLLAGRGAGDPLGPQLAGAPGGFSGFSSSLAVSFGSASPMPAPPMPAPYRYAQARAVAAMSPSPGPGPGAPVAWYYGSRGGGAPAPRQGEDTLLMLLRLPGALPDRLVATVVATWARRITDDDPRVAKALPALHAALYGRALAGARGWLGGGTELDVRLAASPAVARRPDGTVVIELPFSWLSDVWARGFTTLAGRFCLTAQPGPADDWTFTTVALDLGQPQKFTLHPC